MVAMTTMMLKRDSQSMNQMVLHHVNLHAMNIPHSMISQLKKIFRWMAQNILIMQSGNV